MKLKTIHGPNGNGHGTTDCFAATLHLEVSAVLPVARVKLGTAWRAWVDGQRHAADLNECTTPYVFLSFWENILRRMRRYQSSVAAPFWLRLRCSKKYAG
jgi:hypothetical protein